MDKKITTLLLSIVDSGGDIKKLKHYGYSFRQIAEMIEENIEVANLEASDTSVSLTASGKAFLEQHRKLIKETDKSKWISLDYKNKINKIDKDDVFLPSRKGDSFRKKLL